MAVDQPRFGPLRARQQGVERDIDALGGFLETDIEVAAWGSGLRSRTPLACIRPAALSLSGKRPARAYACQLRAVGEWLPLGSTPLGARRGIMARAGRVGLPAPGLGPSWY